MKYQTDFEGESASDLLCNHSRSNIFACENNMLLYS